jgi:hypothetical protein
VTEAPEKGRQLAPGADVGMNTHNDPTTQEVQARRLAATRAFMDRAHTLWHEANGADAACNRCGTTRLPAWVKRAQSGQLVRKDMTGGAA